MRRIGRFLRDNSLSIAFWLLFLASLAGQIAAGVALQSEDPAGQAHTAGLIDYVFSSSFLAGVFSNWQAALLQLATLVVFAVFLRQRGASHSRKPEGEEPARRRRQLGWFTANRSWTYRNSLSLALFALFAGAFAVFFFTSAQAYNADRIRVGEAPMGMTDFLFSAKLWFSTLQTWQAEFFAMGTFLVLTIFLRQEGSAESKRVEAGNDETGGNYE